MADRFPDGKNMRQWLLTWKNKGKGPEPEICITLRDHQSISTSLPKSFVIFTVSGPQTISHQYTVTQIQQLVNDISDICVFLLTVDL